MNTKLIILRDIVNDLDVKLCNDIDNKVISKLCDNAECNNCPVANNVDHRLLVNLNEAINES